MAHYERDSGPRVSLVGGAYQIMGLPCLATFRTRAAAEIWLRDELAKLPEARRPRARACMCCRRDFISEGIHNRLCNGCRALRDATGDVQRPALPSRRAGSK